MELRRHPFRSRVRRTRTVTLAVLGILAVCWLAGPAGAAEERVVLETEVEAGRLILEIDGAEIQIFVEGKGSALLHGTAPATSATPTDLEVVREKGEATLRRRLPVDGGGPRLRLDLLVPPDMPLRISGRDLTIRIEPAILAEGGEAPATSETQGGGGDEPAAWLDLDLESSELIVRGISDIGGKVRHSTWTSSDTLDFIRLALTDSVANFERHRGLVALQIIEGETVVEAAEGSHEIWAATDAQVEVREGRGRLQVQATNGSRLRVDGFRGDVSIEGSRSFVEGRRIWSAGQGIRLDSDEIDFVLEDCRGPFEASLRGGRFSGVGFLGQAKITGLSGASIEIEDLNGQLALWLRGGSVGRLSEVRGRVDANVESARLDVEDAQRLDLTAKDAEIGVRGLRAIAGFRAQGSKLDLDLGTLQGNKPVLHLLSQTRGAIRLAAPCMVQIKSTDPLGASNVDVSGCETKRHGEGNRRRAPARIDGSRMTWLTVDIAPDAEIEIDGY